MATHFSILAWRIPWTEKPQRVRLSTSMNSTLFQMGFPCGSPGKESSCNVGELGSILGLEDPLEKGKATHSSILAWGIPRTVQSMGLQRVENDWAAFTFTFNSFKISDKILIAYDIILVHLWMRFKFFISKFSHKYIQNQ